MTFNQASLNRPIQNAQVSANGINQLLAMQAKTGNGIADELANIGKISRTTDVNELVANGGLNGKTQQEAQAILAGLNGGQSLTKEGQLGVNQLLKSAGANDIQTRQDNRQETNIGAKQSLARFNQNRNDERLTNGKQLSLSNQEALVNYKNKNYRHGTIALGNGMYGKVGSDKIFTLPKDPNAKVKVKPHGGFASGTAKARLFDSSSVEDQDVMNKLSNDKTFNVEPVYKDGKKTGALKIKYRGNSYSSLAEVNALYEKAQERVQGKKALDAALQGGVSGLIQRLLN